MWIGIWRVRTSRFSRSSTERPDWSGRPTSRRMALGRTDGRDPALPARFRRRAPGTSIRGRDHAGSGKGRVVLDDQQLAALCPRRLTVVLDDRHAFGVGALIAVSGRETVLRRERAHRRSLASRGCDRRTVEVCRNDDGKGAALSQAGSSVGSVPPSRRTSSREIERPRPGAAELAADRAVGLMEGLEDPLLLLFGNADAGIRDRKGSDCRRAWLTASVTPPFSVNFSALASRFFSTCSSRWGSVSITGATSGGNVERRSSGPCRWPADRTSGAARSAVRSTDTASGLISTWPASILDRSRMSLIRFSRSLPDDWIVWAIFHLLRGQVVVRDCRPAAWKGSAMNSAACAVHATCWRGSRTCSGWPAPPPAP